MTSGGLKKQCFVISRIGSEKTSERTHADKVLKHVIKKALNDEYEVRRADDDADPGSITPRIVASIVNADLVVADLTGFNANVFYELAIAHGYKKATVQLLDKEFRPPFDLKDINTIGYDITDPDSIEIAQAQLRKFAAAATAAPETIVTPLSAAGGFLALQSSSDPQVDSYRAILEAIEELRADLKRLRSTRRGLVTTREPDRRVLEDRDQLQEIVGRVATAERLEPEDLQEVVTQDTTQVFDKWVYRLLGGMGLSEGEAQELAAHPSLEVAVDDEAES